MSLTKNTKIHCSHSGCNNHHVVMSDFCWEHISDKAAYTTKIAQIISEGDDLKGANLQKVALRNLHLEKARLAKANLSQADLSGTHLFDADLEGADLVGVVLSAADLTHANIRNADLTKAEARSARLWNADLRGANLNECDMSGADLWNARLFNTKLWHTIFKDAKSLGKRSFAHDARLCELVRIDEKGLLSAEESYRDLKGYFLLNGMYNDASWAAFREKTMERLILKKKWSLNYIPSLIMNILCGYGEKPYRIVLSALITILGFALLYFSLQTIESSILAGYIPRFSDCIYYSTITFTTVGYGDFIPKARPLFRLLAASEAFMGVYLTGLFVFTLARKYSAR